MNPSTHCTSFVEPCRIRTLVVPIGKWRKKEFTDSICKLKEYNEVRLLDITPIDSSLFTPQGFPNGRLFFEFISSGYNDALHLFLYDFEPFRKIFVVIGLVNDNSDSQNNLQILKERYPTVISHNLIYTSETSRSSEDPNVFNFISGTNDNLETVVCDIGKNFLQELNHYYSSYKHVTLRSPGAIGGNSVLKTSLTRSTVGLTTVVSSSTAVASKRLSSIEITTGNIKRSASTKIAKSLSTSENRAQHRSQGRQYKILGNFQLLAGRYMDALNSFIEAATLLHKVRDYLWLGSALDGIAICFLLLSYLQISFQIPQIVNVLCPIQAPNAIGVNSPRNSVSFTPMKSPRGSSSSFSLAGDIDAKNFNIPLLISSICDKVMYYYELSLAHNCDYAPQVVYTELLLKTLTFMVACHSSTELSLPTLKIIIQGTPIHFVEDENLPSEPIFSKMDIYSFANKLFELQLKDMEIETQSEVYFTLAQVYGSLDFTRKRSFVLRLLLVALIANPEHIQWRPDYKELLIDMVKLYGIEDRAPESSVIDSSEISWLTLQKKCLQLCVTVSDRVHDHECAAHYAVLLISRYTHLLTRSEQQNILNSYIQPLILEGYIKTYWDPFLLREIKFARLETDGSISGRDIPIEFEITDQDKTKAKTATSDTHEVFNPFKQIQPTSNLCDSSSTLPQGIFLVGDRAMVSCTVQNPFKFDIAITDVQFNSETLKFCKLGENDISLKNPYFIAAESIRLINLTLELKSPTYREWHTISSLKISVMGLPMQEFNIVSSENKIPDQRLKNDRCNTESIQIKILPEQPEIQLLRTENMTDNSWMMLHGTKKKFAITLRNKSLSCPIEYLQFSHITNIEKSMKADYWKKLPLDDLYMMEKQLEWLKSTCIKVLNAPSRMAANEVITLELEIDVTSAPFQFNGFDLIINYGMLANDDSCVYLKKLSLPYNVTLKKSLEVPSIDIIPLNELFSPEMECVDWIEFIMEQQHANVGFHVADYILLLLDIRNSWIDGITIDVHYEGFNSATYLIEANHTTRVIVPIKKLVNGTYNFKNKHIPKVCQDRQYIKSVLHEEQESDMREKFWCREHILSRLKCNWILSTDSSLKGSIDFTQFVDKFDSRMVATMYSGKSPYYIELRLDRNNINMGQTIHATVSVKPTQQKDNESPMLLLNFMIFDNRSSKLLPKSNRRVLYNGTLKRQISATKPAEAVLELVPIERGNYEICACISKTDTTDSVILFNAEPVTFSVN